jgi:adenylylsulfate kinase
MPDTRPGFAIWLTGLPASGKSWVAAAVLERLKQNNRHAVVLESDALRKHFSTRPSYDEQDREYFYGSLAFIGKVLTENGINVVFDATANRRVYRDRARALIPHLLEIHVDTPLEVCMRRDPKGIYKSAGTGAAQHVPGVGTPYEAPLQPDLVIPGDRETPEAAASRIITLLQDRGMLADT